MESQPVHRRTRKKKSRPEPPRKLALGDKSLWQREEPEPKSKALLNKLSTLGERPAFSVAERRSVSALYHYLKTAKYDVSWQASAASSPLWPATFLFNCWALLIGLLGLLNGGWAGCLAVLLGITVYWEWSGNFRVSQLFFAPRGSHYLTMEGGHPTATQTLLLCVGMDTPPGDPVYQPDSLRGLRWMHLQSITPASLLLLAIGLLPLLMIGRWWSPGQTTQWMYWGILGCLAMGCLFFYITAHRPAQETQYNTSIATAFEVMNRLEKLEFPMKIKLVLLGASTHGLGMEAWLRQHSHEHPPESTYVLSVAPYNLDDNALYYRTHEGILRRQTMHSSWVGAAEQTAMRFARETGCPHIPSPQRRFGASLTETAHRCGYPSITLGATSQQEETFLRPDKPVEAPRPSSAMDMMSGWCVAVVQSLVQGVTHKEA